MYCQVCGAQNDPEDTFCRRCQQKLLVISGPFSFEEQEVFENSSGDDSFSLDEHLLERISLLEEVVRRMGEGLRRSLGTLYKLEQKILVNETSTSTLRDLLESKGLVAREEWSELWESRMQSQLLALEKREAWKGVKGRIAALYGGAERRDFRRCLEEADHALLRFDIQGAVRALEAAHRLDPGNHELAFFIAEILFNEGNNEAAEFYFARVLRAAPDHFESLVYGGVLCHVQDREDEAENRLRRAVAAYPGEFLPAFSLGAMYAGRGRLSEATELLEQAVEVEAVPQALLLLGRCHYEQGHAGIAIDALQEALRQEPDSREVLQLLGLALLKRGWYRKARKALQESLDLSPLRLTCRELQRLILPAEDVSGGRPSEQLMVRGRYREALGDLRRRLTEDPDHLERLLAYAMVCLELGRSDEVEPVVHKVLALGPSERCATGARILRMEALRSQGKYDESNREGRSLLVDGPSDFARAFACCEMVWNLLQMHEDLEEALALARQGNELAPPELQPLAFAVLGQVHVRRGEHGAGIDFLRRAVELEPSARTLMHLGLALLAVGERQEVHGVLLKAGELEAEASDPAREVLATLQEGARLLQDAPGDGL